jgi:hypothetical protein
MVTCLFRGILKLSLSFFVSTIVPPLFINFFLAFHTILSIMSNKIISCIECKSEYSVIKTFLRHRRQCHGDDNINQSIKCPLVGCCKSFAFYNQLDSHLKKEHQVDIEFEELNFDSLEDFEHWKRKRNTDFYEQFNYQNEG